MSRRRPIARRSPRAATRAVGASPRRLLPWWAWSIAGLLLAGAGLGIWLAWNAASDSTADEAAGDDGVGNQGIEQLGEPLDPRLTFDTPHLNVRPDVKYVDDARCGECHEDIAASYARHPMGNSFRRIEAADTVEGLAAQNGNPFSRDGYTYRMRRENDKLVQAETRLDEQGQVVSFVEEEMDFAVGAGRHARSYIFERDGSYFYSPVTWFEGEGKWDLSPAFVNKPHHFDEPIGRLCMFCHANRLAPQQAGESRMEFIGGHAIGCQRCHGPGELHVQRREAKDEIAGQDFSIVNPARLEPLSLRDAVCEQCHLEGRAQIVRRGRDVFDFRPGLPLHLFLNSFVPAEADQELAFVGHPEQMRASGCYQGTAGKLGCISCHDPHKKPAEQDRVEFFRGRCLNCHEQLPCTQPRVERLKLSPDDDCSQCHMPRRTSSNIDHVAVSDHRVPRRPTAMQDKPAARRVPPADEPLLRSFHDHLIDKDDPDAQRDLGIALMYYSAQSQPPLRERALRESLLLLNAAVQRDPKDGRAWEAYGRVLAGFRQLPEAIEAYEKAIQVKGDYNTALNNLSRVLLMSGQPKRAAEYAKQAVENDPGHPALRQRLADALLQAEQPAAAAEEYRRVLRINPANTAARQGLADAHFNARRFDEALKEYQLNLRHDPDFAVSRQGAGDCYFELRDWSAALAAYEHLLELQPDNVPIHLRVIDCYRQLGDSAGEQRAKLKLQRVQRGGPPATRNPKS